MLHIIDMYSEFRLFAGKSIHKIDLSGKIRKLLRHRPPCGLQAGLQTPGIKLFEPISSG